MTWSRHPRPGGRPRRREGTWQSQRQSQGTSPRTSQGTNTEGIESGSEGSSQALVVVHQPGRREYHSSTDGLLAGLLRKRLMLRIHGNRRGGGEGNGCRRQRRHREGVLIARRCYMRPPRTRTCDGLETGLIRARSTL